MTSRKHIFVLAGLLVCVIAVVVFGVILSRQLEEPRAVSRQRNVELPRHDRPQANSRPPVSPHRPAVPFSLRPVFDETTGTIQRMKAVDALSRQQSPEALTALRGLLRKADENEALRNNIANKLRECGEPHLVEDLTEMLWDENETPKWRNYCVQHLRACYEEEPDSAILGTLFKAAECDEKMVRICAIWSLARVATPRDKDRMPDEETLGKIHAVALEALREEDAHFLITTVGVQSCARLGLKEALPDIRGLAASDDTGPPTFRTAAVAALGELKDTEGVPLLERLSKATTGQLQAAAELALKRIKESEAAEQVELAPKERF